MTTQQNIVSLAVVTALLMPVLARAQTPPRPNPTENSVTLLGITSGVVDKSGGAYVDANGRAISPNASLAGSASNPPPRTPAALKRYYAERVRAQPASPEMWTDLARACNFDGEIAEAIAAYERVAQLAPATPNLHVWLAELQVAKNDWSAARAAVEREIAAQPQSGWARSWLGSVEYEAGNPAKALAAFRLAAQLDPNAANHRYQSGVWLAGYQHPRRALVDFIAASLMNPQFAAAFYGMADCYAKLDLPQVAIRYYERYLQLDAASDWAARARAEIARLRTTPATASPAAVTPAEMPGVAAITEFQFIDTLQDRVGGHGYGQPDGRADGRFRLGLALPAGSVLVGVKVISADAMGRPGPHVWNSQPAGNWMVGVFRDGAQLNPTHATTLGRVEGRVAFELFMADVGVFKPGEKFLVEVTLGTGAVLRGATR